MLHLQSTSIRSAIALAAGALAAVSCSSSTDPGNASPIHTTFTVTPTSARVGDSVRAEWTMFNSSDKEQSIAFAPDGLGNEYLIGITSTPENTVLHTVYDELLPVQYGLIFTPHEHRAFHAVFIAAVAGQADVQACLPTNAAGDDPWVCRAIPVHVNN
jgi:hypothetical protein